MRNPQKDLKFINFLQLIQLYFYNCIYIKEPISQLCFIYMFKNVMYTIKLCKYRFLVYSH